MLCVALLLSQGKSAKPRHGGLGSSSFEAPSKGDVCLLATDGTSQGPEWLMGRFSLWVNMSCVCLSLHGMDSCIQSPGCTRKAVQVKQAFPPGLLIPLVSRFQSSISVLICCLQVALLLSCYFSQKTSGFSLEKKDDIFFVKFSVVKKSNSCLDFVLSSWEAQQSLASSQFLQAACLISNGHLQGEEETISRWITFCFPEVPP